MPTHTTDPTPPVNARYGAPMGRSGDYLGALTGTTGDDWRPFTLRRLPLDAGGYDAGGAYWGLGEPLFYWHTASVEIPQGRTAPEIAHGYIRAGNRDAAKAHIAEYVDDPKFAR